MATLLQGNTGDVAAVSREAVKTDSEEEGVKAVAR